MGTFSVLVSIGNPSDRDQAEIEALVDTCASDRGRLGFGGKL